MRKDLHDKPFDEGTITKLELFEDYAQAWIPTFVMQRSPTICIFDFFAGTGYDKNKVPGSPIRIFKKIKEFIGDIFQNKIKIFLYLNEFDKDKFELLKSAVNDFFKQHPDLNRAIEIKYFNKDFEIIFHELLPIISKFPSLVYLDQNGIKALSKKYLLELEKIKQTDFLYFASSSYIWRFGDTEEFKTNLEIDMGEVKKSPYKSIHRSFIEQLKIKLPLDSNLKLYPFSIKKGQNIYGIIFGATHPRAVDKFLSIAWKRNEINGEANYDIDDDLAKDQLDLFEGKRLTKIESFQKRLREKILNSEIKNNSDAYKFVLEEGHIGKHASEEIKRMKKKRLINYNSSSPYVTYDNVYKDRKIIEYNLEGKR